MRLYVVEISKYVIAILSCLFAMCGFIALKFKSEKKRAPIYALQIIMQVIILVLSFITIVLRTGNLNYIFYGIGIVLVLSSLLLLFSAFFPDGNKLIINNAAFLMMTSVIMLMRIDSGKALRQMIIAGVSIVAMFIVCEIVYKLPVLTNLTWAYAILGAVFLGIVLLCGSITNGSYISFTAFGVTFQPSEFVKLIFIFFLSCVLCRAATIKEALITFGVAMVYILILMMSRDLGASAILFIIYLAVLFVASRNPAYLLAGVGIGMVGAIAGFMLFRHVRVRVQAWLDPWSTIESTGYQLTQSLFGISSGGWFGLGLFKGNPQTIPYVEDDFIFSAISEEFGIIYSISMILVVISMFLMMLLEASRLRDRWSKYIDCGIAVWLIFQTFLTVGGGSKFIPLTGVTLPLVSYGGTSLMVTMLSIGVFEATCLIRVDEHYEALERYRQAQAMSHDYQD
ncbi:FtsW/RodA/SpoVE family cell cycle protein [Butyrivibrio sp. TB]|uniref:FtsW/RodA/SpoVE family cell cycle protein n=1 Tax=Butyrivibrio sp. TB TaxID=1520809 RepID=UPI0008BA168F|nr:FtsW/RodA/SpoVE family cell cycle protein [Butyrivibrio sp. TB]SEP87804.1 cell division protein FtsW, lipid II flippase [Butyrivibrio sp. TB]